MIKFGMFNSVNGDRKYKADDFAQYFATFIGNGIFVKPSDCLQILADVNSMRVIVRPGKAWINGYYLINDDDYTLALDKGDGTLNRIDRVVIRLDYTERKMNVVVKKGALSSSPIAPTLKRDADAYELALADIYVAKGALTVSQAAITDTRLNNSLCGLMHAVVNQVDTTTIFNQYQSWFNDYSNLKAGEFNTWTEEQKTSFELWRDMEEVLFSTWSTEQKSAFDAWFSIVKDVLDTNAAGNLFNRLEDHKDASMPHVFLDATDNKTYQYGFKTNAAKDGLIFVYEEDA